VSPDTTTLTTQAETLETLETWPMSDSHRAWIRALIEHLHRSAAKNETGPFELYAIRTAANALKEGLTPSPLVHR
jgi:hypothetical protein